MAGHPLPAGDGLVGIAGFAEHLTLKAEHRIAGQQGGAGGAILRPQFLSCRCGNRQGLGLGEALDQPDRVGVADRVLIQATHPDPMGNGRLQEEAATGRRSRSQQQHRRRVSGSSANGGTGAQRRSRSQLTDVPSGPAWLTSWSDDPAAAMKRPARTATNRVLPRPLVLGLAASLVGATGMPLPAQAVDFPRPGVVCDAPARSASTARGPRSPSPASTSATEPATSCWPSSQDALPSASFCSAAASSATSASGSAGMTAGGAAW